MTPDLRSQVLMPLSGEALAKTRAANIRRARVAVARAFYKNPRSGDALMRQLAGILQRHVGELERHCDRAGVARRCPSYWVSGRCSPQTQNLQALLDHLGYRLIIVKKKGGTC